MCAEASKPVIVYCAISRPVANTYQKIGLEKFMVASPKPEAFTVSPKTYPSDWWLSGTNSSTITMKITPAMCQ